ncbi:UNKNOWN [Stylonychia lemnae]|uniref:Uncharacterized protein n=1 Tax=Stylonychia lemnae TaxID=5949 RepID=A0A078AW10_STYLE|nr:UNKNOWN [Stylonychia lemnae]|eukprot:CDW86650.1 UNKNOWN [Stylonychia lemnae]
MIICQDEPRNINELEIQLLQEKVDLLKQKLNLLEELQAAQRVHQEEEYFEYDPITLDYMYKISLNTWTTFREAFQARYNYYLNQISHGGTHQKAIQKQIDLHQNTQIQTSQTAMNEKEIVSFGDEEVRVFDFIQTKSIKYHNAKTNVNQLLIFGLSNGDVVIRNPIGQELLRMDTGLGAEIIDIGSPQTVDEAYFAVMNKKGILKVFNYTIIETSQSFYKYAREKYGLKSKGDSRSEDELKETTPGKKMFADGFPLKFSQPLQNLSFGQPRISQVILVYNVQSVLYKNMKLKTRFSSESNEVTYITKNSNNLMIASNYRSQLFQSISENNSISFVKVFESKLAPNHCDSGTANLKRIASDNQHLGILYGLSFDNEIFIFDQKQHGNKQDTIECKIVGKLEPFASLKDKVNLTMTTLKGGLLFQDNLGNIFYLNTTDIQNIMIAPQIVQFEPSYLKHQNDFSIPIELLDAKEIRNVFSISVIGNLVMMRVPAEKNNKIILLEYASSAQSSSGGGIWDNVNFKFPAIFILILIAVGYMMWSKQQSVRGKTGKAFGLGGGGLSSKAKSSKTSFKRKKLVKSVHKINFINSKSMALKQAKKNDYFQDMRNIDEHTMEEDIELHEYKQKKAQKKKQEVVVTQSYNEVYQQSNEFSRQNEEDIQIIDTQIEEDDQTTETMQSDRIEKMAGSTLQKLKDKLKAAFIKEQEQKTQNTEEIQDSRRLQNKKRDFIDDCKLNFDNNLYPSKLGKMYCFWYNSKYQPRIVLGPDWAYTLIELIIVNSLAGAFIMTIDRIAHEWLFSIGLATLMTQNFTFLLTSLANPDHNYIAPLVSLFIKKTEKASTVSSVIIALKSQIIIARGAVNAQEGIT